MTEPYTPTTEEVRTYFVRGQNNYRYGVYDEADVRVGAMFDRWYVQEIEKAEYSGYLRAVREGLHR